MQAECLHAATHNAQAEMTLRLVSWLRRLNRRRLLRRKAARRGLMERSWLATNDPSRVDIAAALRQRNDSLRMRPLLSIVEWPRHGQTLRPAGWPFSDATSSIYPEWEVLLTGPPAPTESDAARVCRVDVAGHTDSATVFKRLLDAAQGNAIVVVPPDGVIPPHALLLIAETVIRFPQFRLIYGDEACLQPGGELVDVNLRCDWNQELLRSWNYLEGLIVVSRQAIREATDLSCFELAACQWSWLLRLAESATAEQMVHVPHVLCHRTAAAQRAPRRLVDDDAEVSAVQRHLDRIGCAATATAAPEGGVHVVYAIPRSTPLVSIIVPTRNGLSLLRRCIDSILTRSTYARYEVVIVDNGSDEPGTLDYLRHISDDPRVTIMRDPRPFNYSALNNAGAKQCRGDLLALLNNDVEVISPGWLEEMVGIASRPDVGIVGARLWYPDDTLQHAGVVLGIRGGSGHVHRRLPRGEAGYRGRALLTQEFSAVTAACLVLRRDVYDLANGLDEKHLAVDFNDIDLCLRIRQAGYRVIWTPHAELYHHEGATRGRKRSAPQQQRFDQELAYMQATWGPILSRDPAYNPHLSLNDCDFSVSLAPRVDLLTPWYAQLYPPAGESKRQALQQMFTRQTDPGRSDFPPMAR